jgi:type IV pilus assembly protein PilM
MQQMLGWGMKKNLNNSKTYFFVDKPLFGLDIGHDMLRVIQFDTNSRVPRLIGYGDIKFDPSAISEGVITKPEVIAEAASKLFNSGLVGDISTNRVAVSLPASKAFTHALKLPKMKLKDVEEAVLTEAEQYIPTNIDALYIDYTTLHEDSDNQEILIVAFPRNIVDSYLILTRMLGLEAVLMDTTIGASARLFGLDKRSENPAVLIDFGTSSTDITIYNHGLVVTGTVPYGGDDITKTIAATLKISAKEALTMKSNLGLTISDVQKQVTESISPTLELIIKEIKRTIRYYEQRYTDQPALKQVIIMGGGANMPGLADYLTSSLRLAVRTIALENHIDFDHLHPFYKADRMSYVTASGLALTKPIEALK